MQRHLKCGFEHCLYVSLLIGQSVSSFELSEVCIISSFKAYSGHCKITVTTNIGQTSF